MTKNSPPIKKTDFADWLNTATIKEILEEIPLLDVPKLKLLIEQARTCEKKRGQKLAEAAVVKTEDRKKLAEIADAFSSSQLLNLLSTVLMIDNPHHKKLYPLLVGTDSKHFSEILELANDTQLHILQHEGVSEPVQHHLSTLAHAMMQRIEVLCDEIDLFDQKLNQLSVNEICREDALELRYQITLFSEFFDYNFTLANRALAIAWNTDRLDLIEQFNKVKDYCNKYNCYGIGSEDLEKGIATGLFQKLEQQLFSLYGNRDLTNDPDALSDNDPAVEALAKLGIWYLADYWKLGLLPLIEKEEDLDLDLSKHSETERAKYREKLFSTVHDHLKLQNLETVRDLKKACIFSRKSLEEYFTNR